MTFGPFLLKKAYVDGDSFVIELADSNGVVRYRPKRFVSFSRHSELYSKAKRLEGSFVTTETSNPEKNSPEQWWIDINAYPSEGQQLDSGPRSGIGVRPTDEQERCIENFSKCDQLKISAFAGTGKTTTLVGIASANRNKRGLYLAFNTEMAREARTKFPGNVECRTTHSLAYQYAEAQYGREKLSEGPNPNRIADFLNLEPVSFGEHSHYSPRQIGKWILDTLRTFCQSDDAILTRGHVNCDGLGQLKAAEDLEHFTDYLLQCAEYLWQHACDPKSNMPLGHDGYLKLWSLRRPHLAYDFIMLDEAQDTNAAVISALKSQSAKMVYVGDKYQQIYGFRGAFNAMDKIDVENEASLTSSFRFGLPVAEIANAIIARFGEVRRISGNPLKPSFINEKPAKTFIYRTNMVLLAGLAEAIKKNRKPFLPGGYADLTALIYDVELLQSGQHAVSNADFFGFKNWQDLVGFSQTQEGSSYQTTVQIFETYGVSNLKKMIQGSAPTEQDADTVLTTAHKSKGKEWDHVEVCDDFATSARLKNLRRTTYSFDDKDVEEITLLYVALTRARHSLNIPDSVLDVFRLYKYNRDPFAPIPERIPDAGGPTVDKSITADSSALVKPVVPARFVRAQQPVLPRAGSGRPFSWTSAPSNTSQGSGQVRRPLAAEEGGSSGLADANKLMALVDRFKK